ncbi:MAG: DUF354 domain-containing protein [Paracoccaceae bacterium]
MRVLIDILHPAHVHFFKGFRREMTGCGHEVLITAREKDVAVPLLDRLEIPHQVLSHQRTGLGLGLEMLTRTARLVSAARQFRPDVMTGIMGPSIAVAGRLLRTPAVIFYDTEFATQTNWFAYPLATAVCTPDCYQGRVRGNHITYPGYHELAYLHPDRFTPRPERLAPFGVSAGERYFVVRFVSWEASHDAGEVALDLDQKRALVNALRAHGRVVISSETPLPADLEDLRATGPVEDVHHLLAFAGLMVGESATMASEAAVLGTPAVFIATTGRGYTDDQERRYALVRHFKDAQFADALDWVNAALASATLDDDARKARAALLRDKIDVTGWMVDFFSSRFAT